MELLLLFVGILCSFNIYFTVHYMKNSVGNPTMETLGFAITLVNIITVMTCLVNVAIALGTLNV